MAAVLLARRGASARFACAAQATAAGSPEPQQRLAPATILRRSSSKAARQARHAAQTPVQQLAERVSVLPGVGPKYERLLQAHAIRTVNDLMRLHMEGHGADIERTQDFLRVWTDFGLQIACHIEQSYFVFNLRAWTKHGQSQDTVGVTNAGCLRSISEYVMRKQAELQPKVTLSVEGNISAGKSTFLRILEAKGLLHSKLQVVPEPVEKWQAVGPGHVNLLMEFYKDPARFAYIFQNYAFLTRMMQERETYTSAASCRLLERSIFSDRMVFVRSMHAAGYMNDVELSIYTAWFDPVLTNFPTLVPNGFVYLRAKPETCLQRLKRRARSEETTVQLEYMQDLHAKHEDWLLEGGDPLDSGQGCPYLLAHPCADSLLNGARRTLYPGLQFSLQSSLPSAAFAPGDPEQPVIASAAPLPPLPPSLHRAVRFLDTSRGAHMHPLLHMIPVLVLDTDTDVDVERDDGYRSHVATQVSDYADYVRAFMVARGDVVVGLERRMAAATGRQLAGADGAVNVWFPPAGRFSGYTVDVHGTTLYLDGRAPLVAYATPEARHLSGQSLSDADDAERPYGWSDVGPPAQALEQGARPLQHASL